MFSAIKLKIKVRSGNWGFTEEGQSTQTEKSGMTEGEER